MAKGKYQRWLEPDGLIILEGWARDGLTEEQIAKNMGITSKTLRVWKVEHGAICSALKKGREVCDYMVENALVKRALGYSYDEKTVISKPDGTEYKVTTKQVVPDVGAIIFYLKNRIPKKWKDKPLDETDEDTLKKLKELLGGIPSAF